MTNINSVTGPIEPHDLGFALMHEHILSTSWSMRQAFADWLDPAQILTEAIAALRAAADSGVRTIVDATPINLGRDIGLLQQVAQASGIHLLASTGLYWTEEPWLEFWEPDQLVNWLVRDVTEGIQGSGIRAAIIKCGTDHLGLTPLNRKLLQVTARVQRATGLPITTHSSVLNRSALDQLDVFAQEGVDPARVVIGHCGDTDDLAQLETILARGCTIGMDRFRPSGPFPTAKRVAVIAELCRRGYAGQMVLSHDASIASDWWPRRPGQRPAKGAAPFSYIPDEVLPALRAAGVSEEQIGLMTIGNPRRILEPARPA